MNLPSSKFLEPHSDRLRSSFCRWSLLTHLEKEIFTFKHKVREMDSCLKGNKTFTVNPNFLDVEFLVKMLNSKLSTPDHFLGPNHSEYTYLWLKIKGKTLTLFILKSRTKELQIVPCSGPCMSTLQWQQPEPPAQLQQRECLNRKMENMILLSAPTIFSSTHFWPQNLNLQLIILSILFSSRTAGPLWPELLCGSL